MSTLRSTYTHDDKSAVTVGGGWLANCDKVVKTFIFTVGVIPKLKLKLNPSPPGTPGMLEGKLF